MNAGEGMKMRNTLYTVGRTYQWRSMEFPHYDKKKKTRNMSAIWPSNPIVFISKWKEVRHPGCYTICQSQEVKLTQVSLKWWMDKGNVVHIYERILFL